MIHLVNQAVQVTLKHLQWIGLKLVPSSVCVCVCVCVFVCVCVCVTVLSLDQNYKELQFADADLISSPQVHVT